MNEAKSEEGEGGKERGEGEEDRRMLRHRAKNKKSAKVKRDREEGR